MGKTSTGARCDVEGCGELAERSLASDRVRASGLKASLKERRAYLCKAHYREFKKKTKLDRQVEKWRHAA